MYVFQTIRNWRRKAGVVASILLTCATFAHAQEKDPALSPAATAPPYALLQYSTLTGSGNTFTATWVPVVTASGTVYKNLTLLFDVDSSGNLTVAPGYPQVVPTPPPIVDGFVAGQYVGPSTIGSGNMLINVAGPGLTSGGATEWTVSAASGAWYYTYPASGTWYVGPLTSNPVYARIKAAGITSTAWSYGIAGSNWGSPWDKDTLIGVSQIGKTITFLSFTKNGVDYAQPQDQITYTPKQ